MREYAVIDVETSRIEEGKIPKTKFWGYADCSGYRNFKTSAELSKFLRQTPPRVLLHHTNFDVLQLLVDGLAREIQIQSSHRGKLIRCQWGEHTLQNSYAAFPMSLGKIFKAFGYEKTSLGRLEKRNYEDCVNGLECFLRLDSLIESYCGVSVLHRGTIAGTAFKAAERIAGKMPLDLRYVEAYRGGRVDVFDTRQQTAHGYDIHSSYPASFLAAPKSDWLYHVRVNRHEDYFGAYFDESVSDMLLFPNGSFSTWVYKSNLDRYLKTPGDDLSLLERVKIDFTWLQEVCPLIREIYERKAAATDEAVSTACKLLLNSFYGRIGLRGATERASIQKEPSNGDDSVSYQIGKRHWLCFTTVEREARANFPFAAWITCNARARLYEAFTLTAAIYGDTDSVFSRCPESKFPMSQNEACGSWGYLGKGLFQAQNVKDYVFGKKIARKGGSGFLQWTIKDFASGRKVRSVTRNRRSGIRKRMVNSDGTTTPIIVAR